MGRLFEVPDAGLMSNDNKYSRGMGIPTYIPKDAKPPLESLVDKQKYATLIKRINDSNVSEDEKNFLRIAAARHYVFDYGLIADYYANSDKEMQELMEESALVIIDIEDAIVNGYVKLSDRMQELLDESRKIRHKHR